MRLAIAIATLTACATVPVQEMSDARQAIHSAEAVGALQRSPQALMEARRLLQAAQTQLESGAYEDARRYALDAREQAIKAREIALRNHGVLRSNQNH
ncbi:MAG: DUF4398 domain-containing protein [Candidatus Competibacteraceae bacterium]|nr:DUF4398 domain-containing protein [Candidatus Competibacteraceae bacterium]MCB1820630.1 DUF4398 domain-containing protein [Candidatus Competibacteraceae bacterium]HRY14484.1 DUF4398 domain-containing protein [Candidatus Competibacteraceae bacterium]